jgi:transcription-repair coupling factor (superfamily II helicase)
MAEITSSSSLTRLPVSIPRAPGEARAVAGLAGAAQALALAAIRNQHPGFLLIVVPSVSRAEALETELKFFSGESAGLAIFPDAEVLPYDAFSPHLDLISRRLAVLRDLAAGRTHTLLVAASTLLPRLPPVRYITAYSVVIEGGQRMPPEQLRNQLDASGYQRVSQVLEHGDYAVRGSLIDFFPMGCDQPVRIDFLDDEIENLRWFDPDTQASGERLTRLETLPAREFPTDAESIRRFRQAHRRRFEGNPANSLIYREVSDGRLPGGIENYLPLFFEQTALLWDYLPQQAIAVTLGDARTALVTAWSQTVERYEQAAGGSERPALLPDELNGSVDEHLARLSALPLLQLDADAGSTAADGSAHGPWDSTPVPPLLVNRRSPEPLAGLHQFTNAFRGRILFVVESTGRRELLADLLRGEQAPPIAVDTWQQFVDGQYPQAIAIAQLTSGVVLRDAGLAVITEQELFGEPPRARRRQPRARDPEQIISDLTDLHADAPIVHVAHGVGRYRELTTMEFDGVATEFLAIEYAGGDRLFVPVSSLHLVSRYTGANPEEAPLHRLGTDQWAKAKRRAAARLRDVAAELLELYARRAARKTSRPRLSAADYEAFTAGFPFEPTEDQARVFDEVRADLASERPMDRLVCGDVGFGKTEVALRAAFLAVAAGRQVAVLVPTTLLAQQHYQTFADRFAEWPYTVASLSRFRSADESRQTLEGLASGSVDIVVGTHRLLQKDVTFRNLGLLVIDEEHRFGVRHKERLRALRSDADALTLTATPIPRTLNMALGRLRDLSLIATPPESRLTIKTFVTRWEPRIIREACLREFKRGGQVYFVHNRIEDIERVATELAELVPEAAHQVAHGQMRERDLEQVMLDFYHRRFQILVCTAIIESGLDVASANTIIINRADHFGLAQLHQLRGRVGRSHHQAFAYLLTPPREAMTPDAVKRLDAIASLEDLGSGFLLATHDMEIRGAGELLGDEQSGQIQEIGFELYNEMLARTVSALQAGLDPDPDGPAGSTLEINLHLPALLPDDYLPDVHLRLVHYKRIAGARDDDALRELQAELVDRFGPIPPATRNLFRLTKLRLAAVPLGLLRVDAGPTGGSIDFGPQTTVNPAWLVGKLRSDPATYRLDRNQKLRFTADLQAPAERFDFVERLVADMLAGQLPRKDARAAVRG